MPELMGAGPDGSQAPDPETPDPKALGAGGCVRRPPAPWTPTTGSIRPSTPPLPASAPLASPGSSGRVSSRFRGVRQPIPLRSAEPSQCGMWTCPPVFGRIVECGMGGQALEATQCGVRNGAGGRERLKRCSMSDVRGSRLRGALGRLARGWTLDAAGRAWARAGASRG